MISHALLMKATNFAAYKHRDQRRKNVTAAPYINHPIGVAHILASEGKITDPVVLVAALLHDTVEDTDTTFEEIEREFGPIVRKVVDEVTDDKSLAKDERKKKQVSSAPHKSQEGKLVKLADKLYNLRDLCTTAPASWDADRIQGYFVWAYAVTEGLRGTNAELEKALDEVFKSEFTYQEKRYPVLPPKEQHEELLTAYYTSMQQSKD